MNLPYLIKQYMSLREPQEKALEILDTISEGLDYKTTGLQAIEAKAIKRPNLQELQKQIQIQKIRGRILWQMNSRNMQNLLAKKRRY